MCHLFAIVFRKTGKRRFALKTRLLIRFPRQLLLMKRVSPRARNNVRRVDVNEVKILHEDTPREYCCEQAKRVNRDACEKKKGKKTGEKKIRVASLRAERLNFPTSDGEHALAVLSNYSKLLRRVRALKGLN